MVSTSIAFRSLLLGACQTEHDCNSDYSQVHSIACHLADLALAELAQGTGKLALEFIIVPDVEALKLEILQNG